MKQKIIFNKIINVISKLRLFPVSGKFIKKTENADLELNEKKQPNRWWKDIIEERKEEKQRLKELRDDDWYYQHSWFEKEYFIHKLKRKVMNFIYKLFVKSLETYFIEIEFYSPQTKKTIEYNKKYGTNYVGDFRFYLPVITQVKDLEQAVIIMNMITDKLRDEYGITKFRTMRIDKNPMSEERFKLTLEKLNNEYENTKKAKLEILTYSPDNLGNYNYDEPKITEVDIKVIELTKLSWIGQTDYMVLVRKTINEDSILDEQKTSR